MAKYIALRTAQTRLEGRIITVNRGEVIESDEDPGKHFRELELEPVDFDKAGETELLERDDYDLDDLKAYIKDTFDIKVRANVGKEKTIEKLMDARYRALQKHETEGII